MRLHQTVSGATTAKFAYDGLDRIAEYNAANALLRRYVHGPAMDEPLVWYEGSGTTNRRFLSSDERGSIVSVTDSAGAVLGLNKYDEYGQPQSTNLGAFGYTGQAWLPTLGAWYYKARVYEPELGRFLQPDPIGYEDGVNLYAYVGNDPVNFVDPLGLTRIGSGPCPTVGGVIVCTASRRTPLETVRWLRPEVRSEREGPGAGGKTAQSDPVCPAVPTSRPVGTANEYSAAARDPFGAVAAREAANVANTAAAQPFPNLSGHNDVRDAYRHFYWSYAMTRLLGPSRARAFGNAHEAHNPGSPAREQAMDTWNNAVAIAMATDPRNVGLPTADAAEKAMTNGCLRKIR